MRRIYLVVRTEHIIRGPAVITKLIPLQRSPMKNRFYNIHITFIKWFKWFILSCSCNKKIEFGRFEKLKLSESHKWWTEWPPPSYLIKYFLIEYWNIFFPNIEIFSFQSSILARFQNYSKLEETSEEQADSQAGAVAGLGEARRVNDLLGSLAEHPGWSPDWRPLIGPDTPRYSPLIGGHFTVSMP